MSQENVRRYHGIYNLLKNFNITSMLNEFTYLILPFLSLALRRRKINNFIFKHKQSEERKTKVSISRQKIERRREWKKCVRNESNKNFYCHLVAASSHKISAQFFKEKREKKLKEKRNVPSRCAKDAKFLNKKHSFFVCIFTLFVR